MKYMGSKRTMLLNGLGKLLMEVAPRHDRIVDLFCGAGSVSWHAATKCNQEVLSVDLQKYATTLAGAVTLRTSPLSAENVRDQWIPQAMKHARARPAWAEAALLDQRGWNTATWCKKARKFCSTADRTDFSLILRCYGGHYFSPTQALLFDSLLATIPKNGSKAVCLAAVIIAASQCAAAPGHTAQPFQPTRTASPFLRESWLRDPLVYAQRALQLLCPMHATVKGRTIVGDALEVARTLNKRDFVFVDPPYSAVHYSRFYHVLETIARGKCTVVSGTGRYPPPTERPTSSFSRKGEASAALVSLLEALASSRCTVAFTFPYGKCSNGLSGRAICEKAKRWFSIEDYRMTSRFSTLGGNNDNRDARQHLRELILLLRPMKRQPRTGNGTLLEKGRAIKPA